MRKTRMLGGWIKLLCMALLAAALAGSFSFAVRAEDGVAYDPENYGYTVSESGTWQHLVEVLAGTTREAPLTVYYWDEAGQTAYPLSFTGNDIREYCIFYTTEGGATNILRQAEGRGTNMREPIDADSLGRLYVTPPTPAPSEPESSDSAGTAETIPVTVTLDLSEASRAPACSFTVTATPTGAMAASAPAIASVTLTLPAGDKSGDQVSADGTLPLPQAGDFYAAGDYTYSIALTSSDSLSGLTVDAASYTLTLRVYQTNSDTYAISGTTLTGDTGKVSALTFSSAFSEDVQTTTFSVSQRTEGSYADGSKVFTYTLRFTAPTFVKSVRPVADQSLTAGGTTLAAGDALSFDADYTFQLSSGQSVTFTLPVGSGYTLTQTAEVSYTPAAALVDAGVSSAAQASTGEALSVTGIATDRASAAFTNTFVDNPLTGVVRKDGPFAVLILVALLILAGYLFSRRRAAGR